MKNWQASLNGESGPFFKLSGLIFNNILVQSDEFISLISQEITK